MTMRFLDFSGDLPERNDTGPMVLILLSEIWARRYYIVDRAQIVVLSEWEQAMRMDVWDDDDDEWGIPQHRIVTSALRFVDLHGAEEL